MTVNEALLNQPAAQAIAWALLHFFWQGALVGVVTWLTLVSLRRSAADVRYVVATVGLSLMLTLPVATALQAWRAAGQPSAANVARAATAPAQSVDGPAASAAYGRTVGAAMQRTDVHVPAGPRGVFIEGWQPLLLMVWLCGVVVLSLRLLSGWLWVQRMKSHGTRPARELWQRASVRLCRHLHIRRRVRLLESTRVDVPTVIGWLKPVVLLPTSAIGGLAPEQLEAILAHELAHIRRHDYLVNLLQTLVETLLFYHPAVWWLSNRIRVEREHCCDDLAVSLCGDPYAYAQALADLEGLRGPSGQFAVAVTGGSLVERVRRLLGAPSHAGRCPGWLAGTAAAALVAGIVAGGMAQELSEVQKRPASSAPKQAAAAPRAPQRPAEPVERLDPAAPLAEIEPLVAGLLPVIAGLEPALSSLGPALESLRPALAALEPALAALQPALAALEPALAALQPALDGLDVPALEDASREFEAHAFEMAMQGEAAREALAAHGPEMEMAAAFASTAAIEEPARAAMELAARSLEAHATALASAESAFALPLGPPGQDDRIESHFSWSNGGQKIEIRSRGTVEFTDDDTDVKSLSPGGQLRIKDGGWVSSRTVEFTADGSGVITRRYWAGMFERPFEPDGRAWLASALPRIIRQVGLGAPARVARILKAKGVPGVLAEIALIEGSWGKRIYFTQLLKTAQIDGATATQIVSQAGREIDSDFELASLLIDSADRLLVDEQSRRAYFDAARSIDSDFEMRRVFSSALKRGPLAPDVMVALLAASTSIDSDFEAASLLIDVVKTQPLDDRSRGPFFKALDGIGSDFEQRRVLSQLARTNPDEATTLAMLQSAVNVGSDFEEASFLVDLLNVRSIEGTLRPAFFKAVDGLESSFERARVLKAVVGRPDASPETVLAVLQSAGGMGSSFETSQVLLAVASRHSLSGPARDAYIGAAEHLGDFEQSRALAALVKSERGRK